jgi:hypothetical protein
LIGNDTPYQGFNASHSLLPLPRAPALLFMYIIHVCPDAVPPPVLLEPKPYSY